MAGVPQLYSEPQQPKLLRARTVNTPGSAADKLFVSIDSFPGMGSFGPCDWTPHGTALPPAGTRCLVAMDENDLPWVISWVGPWT
jgi:hypothetical protein